MKKANWKTYLFWIALAEAVGALAGIVTRQGMKEFEQSIIKPPLTPPGWVFPVVWSILYALMGIGAARISVQPNNRRRNIALNVFITQLVVNFFWSLFFFNAQAFGFAFAWLLLLWVLIAIMIFIFQSVETTAAWLQVPYILWVTFAGYLNLGVWLLN